MNSGKIEAKPFEFPDGSVLKAAFYVISGYAAHQVNMTFEEEDRVGYYPQKYSVSIDTLEGKQDPYMSIGLYSEQDILLDDSQVGPIRRFFYGFR